LLGDGITGMIYEARPDEIVEAVEALVNNELFFDPEQPTSIA